MQYKTEGGETRVPLPGKPRALRFLSPHECIVREADLPADVPLGEGTHLAVLAFQPGGVVIDESSNVGIAIEVQVFYEWPPGVVAETIVAPGKPESDQDWLERFNSQWTDRETRIAARQTALDWIEANPGIVRRFARKSIEELVKLVDAYRLAGQDTERTRVDMWLSAMQDPQQITGEGHPRLGGVEGFGETGQPTSHNRRVIPHEVAPPVPPFSFKPHVYVDRAYGKDGSGSAFYVRIAARAADGNVHPNSQARLVSIEPTASSPGMDALKVGLDEGLLQWSSKDGGHEVATITPGGANLDVMAFENNDRRGLIVYADHKLRGSPAVLVEASPYTLTVEISSTDGSVASCSIEVKRGTKGENSGEILASPEGTLYGPIVTRLGMSK